MFTAVLVCRAGVSAEALSRGGRGRKSTTAKYRDGLFEYHKAPQTFYELKLILYSFETETETDPLFIYV